MSLVCFWRRWKGADGFDAVALRWSPSYSDFADTGGFGRLGSWERSERWRVRGVRPGFSDSLLGESSDVLDALRDGGPTKSAGAGSRVDGVLLRLFDITA
jgi:hypothetical protein